MKTFIQLASKRTLATSLVLLLMTPSGTGRMGKDVSKYSWHRVLHGPDLGRASWIYASCLGNGKL
jgi:hypothetical protein